MTDRPPTPWPVDAKLQEIKGLAHQLLRLASNPTQLYDPDEWDGATPEAVRDYDKRFKQANEDRAKADKAYSALVNLVEELANAARVATQYPVENTKEFETALREIEFAEYAFRSAMNEAALAFDFAREHLDIAGQVPRLPAGWAEPDTGGHVGESE